MVLILGLAIGLKTQFGWIAWPPGSVDCCPGSQRAKRFAATLRHSACAARTDFLRMYRRYRRHDVGKLEARPRADRRHLASVAAVPAIAVPAIILLQTTLGACVPLSRTRRSLAHPERHDRPASESLIVAVFLVRQFPEHPTLRPAAVALAVITSHSGDARVHHVHDADPVPGDQPRGGHHQRPARHHRLAHFWRRPRARHPDSLQHPERRGHSPVSDRQVTPPGLDFSRGFDTLMTVPNSAHGSKC